MTANELWVDSMARDAPGRILTKKTQARPPPHSTARGISATMSVHKNKSLAIAPAHTHQRRAASLQPPRPPRPFPYPPWEPWMRGRLRAARPS